MEEYPRNLSELEAWFDTEQACREYLFRLRWPEGFRCPQCDGRHFWAVAVDPVPYKSMVKCAVAGADVDHNP